MKIELVETQTPRIYKVVLDFTGYHPNKHYATDRYGNRAWESTFALMDDLLASVKVRRISYWRTEYSSHIYSRRNKRYLLFWTIVISDRMNKRNDRP